MKTPRVLSRFLSRRNDLFRALILASATASWAAGGATQFSSASAASIESLRSQIERASASHSIASHSGDSQAGDKELGTLWLQLANAYHSNLQLTEAEDAFGRSLSLLRSPSTRLSYADALDGLGSVYIATARPADAVNCMRKALAIYADLGDQIRSAHIHEAIAIAVLLQGRTREGERQSAEALRELEAASKLDVGEVAVALLTHSYALCLQHRHEAALEDVERASQLVLPTFSANSLQMATVWLARGFVQWKSGSADEAGISIREAIRIARGLTGEPRFLATGFMLDALQQYDAYLKGTHHKPEAREVEDEIARLQSITPSVCHQCTVNAAALLPTDAPP